MKSTTLLFVVSLLALTVLSSCGRTHTTHKHVVAAIASKNHLYRVRAFFDGVKKHGPPSARHLLLVDAVDGYFDPAAESFELIQVRDLPTMPMQDIDDMLAKYSVIEANNNFKGAYLLYLLNAKRYDKALLFDPDAFITSSLEPLFSALDQTCTTVTTPHAVHPVPTGEVGMHDLTFLKYGTLNLGLIGVSRGPRTDSFLQWWQRKTQHEGFYREEQGMFSDQKWLDLAFSYFGDVHCTLRNQTLNVAYWNLHDREHLIRHDSKGRYFVGNDPMMFYHFSAWDADTDAHLISRFETLPRTLDNVPQLKLLYAQYRRLLLHHLAQQDTRPWPYALKKQ